MTATVCTCIRHERDARMVAVPDPTCPHGTTQADREATRPSWDTYFLGIAEAVSTRADCRRRKVGAVLVGQDKRVLEVGYNGAPSGHPGCLNGHCPRGLLSYEDTAAMTDYSNPASPAYCIALHAEVNALLIAGRAARGATMYITDEPCPNCVKAMRGAGVARAVWPEYELDTTIPKGEPQCLY